MKKIGLLCLAIVLALGAMGGALAYWNETLTISGTVATGVYDVEFNTVGSSDTGVDPLKVGTTTLNVASCTAVPSGPTGADEGVDNGYDVITIDIDNAYPCYNPVVSFNVNNLGSIPAKIVSVTISDDYSNFKIGGGTPGHSLSIASGNVIDVDLGTSTTPADGNYDLRIVYTGVSALDVLSEAGGSAPSTPCSLNIHVWESGDEGSNATENADGSFTITIPTTQFNN